MITKQTQTDGTNTMPKLIQCNDDEFTEAISQIKKAFANTVCAHPYIYVDVYELKDGSTLIDQPGYGAMIFPPEHDTIRYIKRMIKNIDGSEPKTN